jgi:hypothetical protein
MSPRTLRRYALFVFGMFALAAAARADMTVSGTFLYVDRAFTINGFSGSEPSLPVRLATVQVINASNNAVLATGATTEAGTFSIPVSGSSTANLLVRCFSRTNQFGAGSHRVTNTSNVEYSVSSATFSNQSLTTNLAIGTVTAQKVTANGQQGGPFNMLDQMVHALQYVKAQGAANPTSSLRMNWPGGGGSFASGVTATIADDDGFDDTVQLHEMGHVIHNHYSSSDNPGGSHFFGDSDQDPRLSFGEGYATYFAGAVRRRAGIADPGIYLDLAGSGVTGAASIQLRVRLENAFPIASDTAGEADEVAVACSLYDLVDTTTTVDTDAVDDDAINGSVTFAAGIDADRMLWNSLVGPVKTAPNTTIRDIWNGLFAPVAYADAVTGPLLATVFVGWKQRFTADATENNDTLATATPHTLGSSWSVIRTLYRPTGALAGPGDGDLDHYSFALTSGSTFSVETRYPNAASDADTYADTFLTVLRPDGSVFAQSDVGGTGRNAKLTSLVANQSGTWVARVSTVHAYRKTGSYQFRATLDAPPAGGCVNVASASNFGVAKPGAAGAPTLTSTSPVIPSAAFTLSAGPFQPLAAGVLFLGVQAIDLPFDGGHLYVNPLVTLPIASNAAGLVSLTTPLSDVATCGLSIHLQAVFANDPGATGGLHTAQTPRLTLIFGG